MPALDASTTAVFSSVGLSASSIYAVFTGLVGSAVAFGLWLIQVAWPFMLVIGLIYLLWGIARRFMHIGR